MYHYDKFSYSHQRNLSDREVVSPSSPGRASSSPSTKNNRGKHRDFCALHDPSASVLNPLRHGAYSFGIAEDGILHSRIVAPPRICYAPVISELDVPHALPDTPWQRLNKYLLSAMIIVGDQQQREVPSPSSTASPPRGIAGVQNFQDVDFSTFGSYEWEQIEGALSALEQEDLEREQTLEELIEEEAIETGNVSERERKIAFYQEQKKTFETEKVTAVDRAKIELIWKKARMLVVENAAEKIFVNSSRPTSREPSFRISSMSSPQQEHEKIVGNGARQRSASGGASSADSSSKLSRKNSVFGSRGMIFNEKLRWTNKPKVNSNNVSRS